MDHKSWKLLFLLFFQVSFIVSGTSGDSRTTSSSATILDATPQTPTTVAVTAVATELPTAPSTHSVLTSSAPEIIDAVAPLPDMVRVLTELSALSATVQGLGGELDKFQGLLVTQMDTKLVQLISSVSEIDANVKTLQDRAHVWDLFKHHIDSWTDHIISVDKKIDLIKRSQETNFAVDSKLANLEQKTNHVYERVDMVNEKMHDMLKILYNQNIHQRTTSASAALCEPTTNPSRDSSILQRLANIERQITMIQNSHCKSSGRRGGGAGKANNNNNPEPQPPVPPQLQSQPLLDTSVREFKQLLMVNKKALGTVEYLNEAFTTLNSTTNRIQKSLSTCCRHNEVRVTLLRDSVDSAFQKLERIYLNLEQAIKTTDSRVPRKNGTSSTVDLEAGGSAGGSGRGDEENDAEEDEEEEEASGSGSGDREWKVEDRNNEGKDKKKMNKSGTTTPEPENPFIRKQSFRNHCHELKALEDGIYHFGLSPAETNEQGRTFSHRYCHFDPDGSPGWTVIQRRGGSFEGEKRMSFNRSWSEYKGGFGDLDKEFWYGNDFIHQLTNDEGQVELRVEMEDFRGNRGVAHYNRFYVSSERSFYRLDVEGFGGNIPDSLLYHNQMYFSTFDSANDHSEDVPCALSHGSGWWWNNCLESNLNGKYSDDPLNTHFTGIIWEHWLGDYSLKETQMMVRPLAPNGLWIDTDEDEEGDEVGDGPMRPPEDP